MLTLGNKMSGTNETETRLPGETAAEAEVRRQGEEDFSLSLILQSIRMQAEDVERLFEADNPRWRLALHHLAVLSFHTSMQNMPTAASVRPADSRGEGEETTRGVETAR
jgi:hypothetical protein